MITGTMYEEIPTPFVLIDEATARRNVRSMGEYAAAHGLQLRPHTKTHKTRRIAQWQIEAGAIGLTTAKVGEAEVMADVSDDLLLAYPAVDRSRTSRLARLALHKTVRVGIDSKAAADALSAAALATPATIGILVDLDVGMHRTGVQTPAAALALAQHVDSAAGLRLDGIMCFPGHTHSPGVDRPTALAAVSDMLCATIELWAEHGLEASIVSGGSTPSARYSHLIEDLTEIRPGTYVYYDANCVDGGFCTLDDCAVRVICTVVSDAVPNKIVIDAGSKTLTSDRNGYRDNSGHGIVVEFPEACITRLTEEHGEVDITRCDRRPRVGERVTVIPNHVCPCINLHQSCYLQVAPGSVEPLPVDARGMVS